MLRLNPKLLPIECEKLTRFQQNGDELVMLCGPVETSKTLQALLKLFVLHEQIPKFQSMVLRNDYSDIKTSIIPTIENDLLDGLDGQPFTTLGFPSQPDMLRWDNGGATFFRGLDGLKMLGTGFDMVFVSQLEQCTQKDFIDLVGRCGRSGNWFMNGTQIFQAVTDCNPEDEYHWINQNKDYWDTWFDIHHDSNPLFVQGGEWTEHGIERMDFFRRRFPQGHMYDRRVEGQWVSVEGLVYAMFASRPNDHIVSLSDTDLGANTRWYLGVDFNMGDAPSAAGIYGLKDDTLYLFKEIYHRFNYLDEYIGAVQALLDRYNIKLTAAYSDHQTVYVNEFRRHGIDLTLADKEVLPGIESVKRRFQNGTLKLNQNSVDDPDPSLVKGKTCLTDELRSYRHLPPEKQLDAAKPDHPPRGQENHACDVLRYVCHSLETQVNEYDVDVSVSIGPAPKEGLSRW